MGQLSRKHRKNRGERYERRKRSRAFYRTTQHGTEAAIRKLVAEMVADYRAIADAARATRGERIEQYHWDGRAAFHPPRQPIARTWTMSETDRGRLAAYNDRHVAGVSRHMALTISREWLLRMAEKEDNCIVSVGGLAVDLGMMTTADATRAYDEATPVPLSRERIEEIVAYATGRQSAP